MSTTCCATGSTTTSDGCAAPGWASQLGELCWKALEVFGQMFLGIKSGLALTAVAVAFAFPAAGSRLFEPIERAFIRLARRQGLAVAVVGVTALVWARELTRAENQDLLHYFKDRNVGCWRPMRSHPGCRTSRSLNLSPVRRS